jgi:hypothetical protein
MSNNVLESLNSSLNEILQNYLSICSKFAMKKKYIDNDEILNNEITYLQISMNDLVIQLQNINFKIDNFKIDCLDDETLQNNVNSKNILLSNTPNISNTSNSTSNSNSNIDLKTNRLLDKTINDLLPLFMLGLMNNDKDSILNNNTFMNNIKETIYSMSNQISTTTPMQNTQNTQNINNYTSCIDDLD